MINKSKILYILSFMVAMFIGCEDTNDDPVAPSGLETPSSYVFESRFNEGESSVSYSGQGVRNLLINDIKTQCGTDAGT